jgi:hypothetical protein
MTEKTARVWLLGMLAVLALLYLVLRGCAV